MPVLRPPVAVVHCGECNHHMQADLDDAALLSCTNDHCPQAASVWGIALETPIRLDAELMVPESMLA